MNVLIILQWPAFWAMGENTGASSFFETAHGYVTHGHRVRVVLPTMTNEADGEYHSMSMLRVPFDEDPMTLSSGVSGLIDRITRYNHFRRTMREATLKHCMTDKPDVIVALGPHSAAVAHDVAKQLNIPNITRLFGQALSLYINERGSIANPRFFGNFAEIIAFRSMCDALIVHNDGSRGDKVASLMGASDRLHYWRDGVDRGLTDNIVDRDTARREIDYEPDDIVIASIGRLSIEKSLGKLVTALAGALPEVPQLKLLFVGEGPDQPTVEALAKRLGVADRVRFAGPTPRDKIHVVFQGIDMLVSTSPRTNMTNSTIEAMAFAIPVVAVDAGDTRDVVRDGESGILVPRDDEAALCNAVTMLAKDEALRTRIGEGARSFVQDNFESVPKRVEREIRLVESIVSARTQGRGQ
jgi:glycosyltransferase involved in cell wall biosynthesis